MDALVSLVQFPIPDLPKNPFFHKEGFGVLPCLCVLQCCSRKHPNFTLNCSPLKWGESFWKGEHRMSRSDTPHF